MDARWYAVLGTVLGVLVTVIGTYWITRARIRIRVTSVSLKTPLTSNRDGDVLANCLLKDGGNALVRSKPSLYASILDNQSLSFFKISLDHVYTNSDEYIRDLYLKRHHIKKLMMLHSNMPLVLENLRQALLKKDKLGFLREWKKSEIILKHHVLHGVRRRELNLPFEEESYNKCSDAIVKEGNGGYHIVLENGGVIDLSIDSSNTGDKMAAYIRTGLKAVGVSLYLFDAEKLSVLVSYLSLYDWDDREHKNIVEQIDLELDKYSKVVLKGVVVNSGRSAGGLMGLGHMVINSKGCVYKQEGKSIEIEEQIGFDVAFMQPMLLNSKDSIQVPAGGVVKFEAHSTLSLLDMEFGQDIRGLFEKEKLFVLAFRRSGIEKYCYSKPHLFCSYDAIRDVKKAVKKKCFLFIGLLR